MSNPLRLGIGGPVGSGKTALMDWLCKSMRGRFEIAAITNDIYTREDAEFLTRSGALPPERIRGVETGGCPHTAIREDASINLAAVAEMQRLFPDLDLILIESGGDNLAATFSPELADLTIYVIDVAAGDKIPRKGGPGITRSDLLVINKTDLAPLVGASLEIMDRDAKRMRGDRPFVFTNLKTGEGIDHIRDFVVTQGGLQRRASTSSSRRATSNAACRMASRPRERRGVRCGFASARHRATSGPRAFSVWRRRGRRCRRRTLARASAPCAITAAVSALTAPCAAIVREEPPAAPIWPRSSKSHPPRRHRTNPRSRSVLPRPAAGTGFRCRQPPIAGTAGVENRLREAQRFSFEHRMLHLAPTGPKAPEQRKPQPADRRA